MHADRSTLSSLSSRGEVAYTRSIGWKIGRGFVLTTLVTLAVGGAGVYAINSLTTAISRARSAGEAFVMANSVSSLFRTFLETGAQDDNDHVLSSLEQTLTKVDFLAERNDSDTARALAEMRDQVTKVSTSQKQQERAIASIDLAIIGLSDAANTIMKRSNVTYTLAASGLTDIQLTNSDFDKTYPLLDSVHSKLLASSSQAFQGLAQKDTALISAALESVRAIAPEIEAAESANDPKTAELAVQLRRDTEAVRNNLAELPELVAGLIGDGSAHPSPKRLDDAIAGLGGRMQTAINHAADAKALMAKQREALSNDITAAIEQSEEARTNAKLGREIDSAVSKLVIASKSYLLTPTEKNLKAVSSQIDEVHSIVKSTRIASEFSLEDKLTTFRASFADLTRTINELTAVRHASENIAARSGEGIAAVVSSVLDSANSMATLLRAIMVGTASAGLLIAITLCIGIARSISNPIRFLTTCMRRLAEGDIAVTAYGATRQDEIGEMARAVEIFRGNAAARLRLEGEVSSEEEKRLRRQQKVEYLIDDFRDGMEGALASVGAQVDRLQSTARDLTGSAEMALVRTSDATDASNQASSGVTTVAAAAEELAVSIREIGSQVAHTVAIVGQAGICTQQSSQKISGLAASANRIGSVIMLIRSIAEQTNLLALNATIEAARAGVAGRGFAVVAGEVKQLADQTAKATTEIASQIEDIQVATADAVQTIQEIARSMDSVNGYTGSIAAAVDEQGTATSEISRSAQTAAHGATAVANQVCGLVDLSNIAAKGSREVSDVASQVHRSNIGLSQRVEMFLKEVAAA